MSAPYILRRDGHDYQAPDLETLRAWAQAGRVLPADLVYSPVYQSWYRASDLRGLRDVLPDRDGGPPPLAVSQCFWLRKGDQNFAADTLEIVLQWATEGIIDPEDFIFHPAYGKWFQAGDSPQLTSRFPPHIQHQPPFLPASADPMASAEARHLPDLPSQAEAAQRAPREEPAQTQARPASVESADSMARTVMDMKAIRVEMLRPVAAATPEPSPAAQRPVESATAEAAQPGQPFGGGASLAPLSQSRGPAGGSPGQTSAGSGNHWQTPAGGLFGSQRGQIAPSARVAVSEASARPSDRSASGGREGPAPGAAVLRKSGAHPVVDAAMLREAEQRQAERDSAREKNEPTPVSRIAQPIGGAVQLPDAPVEPRANPTSPSEATPARRVTESFGGGRLEPSPGAAPTQGVTSARAATSPLGSNASGALNTGGGTFSEAHTPAAGVFRPMPSPQRSPVVAEPASTPRSAPVAQPLGAQIAAAVTPLARPLGGAEPTIRQPSAPAANGFGSPNGGSESESEPARASRPVEALPNVRPAETRITGSSDGPGVSAAPRSPALSAPVAPQIAATVAPASASATPQIAATVATSTSQSAARAPASPPIDAQAEAAGAGLTGPILAGQSSGRSGPKPPPLPAAVLASPRPAPPPLPLVALSGTAAGASATANASPAASRADVADTPIAKPVTAPVDPPAKPSPPSAPPEYFQNGAGEYEEIKFTDRLGLMKLFYDAAKVFVYTRDLRPGELLESSCTLGQGGEDFLGTSKRGIYVRLGRAIEEHLRGVVQPGRPQMGPDELAGYDLMCHRAELLLAAMRRAEPVIGSKPPERFVVGNMGRPKMSPEEESSIVEIDATLKRLISTRAKVAAGRAA